MVELGSPPRTSCSCRDELVDQLLAQLDVERFPLSERRLAERADVLGQLGAPGIAQLREVDRFVSEVPRLGICACVDHGAAVLDGGDYRAALLGLESLRELGRRQDLDAIRLDRLRMLEVLVDVPLDLGLRRDQVQRGMRRYAPIASDRPRAGSPR